MIQRSRRMRDDVMPIGGRSRAPAPFGRENLYPRLRPAALAGYTTPPEPPTEQRTHETIRTGQRTGKSARNFTRRPTCLLIRMGGASNVKSSLGLIPDQDEFGVIEQVLEVARCPVFNGTDVVLIAQALFDLRQFRFAGDDAEEARIGPRVAQLGDLVAMGVGQLRPPSSDCVLIDIGERLRQLGRYRSHGASASYNHLLSRTTPAERAVRRPPVPRDYPAPSGRIKAQYPHSDSGSTPPFRRCFGRVPPRVPGLAAWDGCEGAVETPTYGPTQDALRFAGADVVPFRRRRGRQRRPDAGGVEGLINDPKKRRPEMPVLTSPPVASRFLPDPPREAAERLGSKPFQNVSGANAREAPLSSVKSQAAFGRNPVPWPRSPLPAAWDAGREVPAGGGPSG